MNEEIIEKMQSIQKLCIENNLKEPYNLIFWCNFTGHVNWFEVEVSKAHYEYKIEKFCVGLTVNDAQDLECIINSLNDIEDKLNKLIKGKFSVTSTTKYS